MQVGAFVFSILIFWGNLILFLLLRLSHIFVASSVAAVLLCIPVTGHTRILRILITYLFSCQIHMLTFCNTSAQNACYQR